MKDEIDGGNGQKHRVEAAGGLVAEVEPDLRRVEDAIEAGRKPAEQDAGLLRRGDGGPGK